MTPAMRYGQGEHYLVAGPVSGCLVPDRRLAQRAWPSVRAGASMTEILGQLLSNGLESLPDLAVWEFDSAGMRVILRGDMTATVESADGSAETSTGHARRTWLEHVFLSAVSGTVGAMDMGDADLPLHVGMTRAGGFVFSANEADDERAPLRKPRPANDARVLAHLRPRPDNSGGSHVVSLLQRPAEGTAAMRSQ